MKNNICNFCGTEVNICNKNISRTIIIVLLLIGIPTIILAQQEEGLGKISLNPYIPESENIGTKALKSLTSKLGQIATVAGMSGKGFDNRFVITAHLQELDCETTATYPPKTALRASINIYVGDGIDGTLFSSYSKEYKGFGDSREDAYAAIVKKLKTNDPELLRSIEVGKERIVQYYNQVSGNIIKTAEADANAGHYEKAITTLFSIPMACKDYNAAQDLIARLGVVSLETSNMKLIEDARAAWNANPSEEGASKAINLLNQLQTPSAKTLASAKVLSNEIGTRLKSISDREWQLTVQQSQNEHEVEMAKIESEKQQNIATVNAAASVARAYYNNRPRVVYHVHWW